MKYRYLIQGMHIICFVLLDLQLPKRFLLQAHYYELHENHELSYRDEVEEVHVLLDTEKHNDKNVMFIELDSHITFSSSILAWASFLNRMFGEKPRVNLC